MRNVQTRHINPFIRILCALILMMSALVSAYAQQNRCTVSGQVADRQNQPVAYASVAIYDGTSPIAGTITDDNGRFTLKLPAQSLPCQLIVDFIGYVKYSQSITLDKQSINIGQILLDEDAILLEGTTVTAKEVSQKQTVEHTSINASASMVADKGTAADILRSSSAVTFTDGEISIRGNSNILVLLDGVPTTAGDLSAIPAANIKNIEVITNPDASHDASGTGGIINIVSRKTSLEGFSGILSANYGFNHFVTGNAAFSYTTPKTSYRFSYNTKYEDDIINTSLLRHIKATGNDVLQKMRAERYTYNNNISLGADFRLNPENRLSIDIKCIIPRSNNRQQLFNTFTENEIITEESRYNDVTWNRENIEGSVSYTHIITPDISDISVKGSVSKIWGHRPSYYYLEGDMTSRSNSGGSPLITAIQADYKHKFKAGTLSAGAKFTYRRNDIYHEFYELTGGKWMSSDVLSNDLVHTESVPAIYALFASGKGKKFTYKAGVRSEMSIVTLDSEHDDVSRSDTRFFIAPSLSGTYRFKEGHELSLVLSRRIGRPSYPQLNPYMSMVDAITYQQGNMYLKPEKSTKADVSYNFRTKGVNLFINGYVNHTADYISQITMIDTGRLITTYVNADSDIKTGIDISLRYEPARWVKVSLAANTFYVSTKGQFNGAEISNEGVTNNSNVLIDFIPWKGADLQCQYFVTTPQYFPQLTASLTHQMNIGLKQTFLKGTLTASALLTDVFNTAKWEVWSHNNIFDLTNISRNKSRMLWLGISYNFNSFKQRPNQKKETDRELIRFGN
ncbi:MAG: TonB-dependent receptor [Bacteroidales bacterium]|nr:TonB-dependent receptor [Bacteroidales bacterium]